MVTFHYKLDGISVKKILSGLSRSKSETNMCTPTTFGMSVLVKTSDREIILWIILEILQSPTDSL